MYVRRLISAFALAVCFSLSVSAQEPVSFVRRVIDRFTSPSAKLDSAAIYQPAPRWTFALTGDLRTAGAHQEHRFNFYVAKDGSSVYEEVPAWISSSLAGNLSKGVGVQAGYGRLSMSLSKRFRGEGAEKLFSFDYLSAGAAVQVQFFNLSHPVEYNLVIGEKGHWAYYDANGVTDNPGKMRSLIVDAFYALNRRTFAYSAAYKGCIFQRRSSGSWIVGGKLILGEFEIDPSEEIPVLTVNHGRQTSTQVSLGGGYSYNFVPLHRQPYAERDKGLRNLTVNVTAMPMLTFLNQFASTAYGSDAGGKNNVPEKYSLSGYPKLNYVSRVGLGYSYDLFTVNLSASYDSFAYKGTTSLKYEGISGDGVETSGRFYRWTVALRLGKRF